MHCCWSPLNGTHGATCWPRALDTLQFARQQQRHIRRHCGPSLSLTYCYTKVLVEVEEPASNAVWPVRRRCCSSGGKKALVRRPGGSAAVHELL